MTADYDRWKTSEPDVDWSYCLIHRYEGHGRACPHCADDEADRQYDERKESR